MVKRRQLVILGDSAFAEVAYECFTHDSDYEVVGFAVEAAFLKRDRLFGLPVVAFETLEQRFPPARVEVYAALVYSQLNRLRTRLYQAAKARGYRPASYLSSRAFVWHNVVLGEHCFVFEDNTLQPFARIGDNVVIWSGSHIGHHSVVEDNCFIARATVSGFCRIGRNSFLGVNAAVANNVTLGADNWVGVGVAILQDTPENSLYRGEQPAASRVSARRFHRVPEA